MSANLVLPDVRDYYAGRLREHGATPRGVDWNGVDGQLLRFSQLLAVCRDDRSASLGDYGCGYGALLEYAREQGYTGPYRGYDIVPNMVQAARQRCPSDALASFSTDEGTLAGTDYLLASGIFNVKLLAQPEAWLAYIEETIARLASLARKGFSFNALTSYADEDRKRKDLYYADPCRLFDVCRRRYSRHVALLHDYGLWEFTILVRY